jgi:N-acetyl-alpha-D-muramate 1-phosphate uridylyltransferase
MADSLAGLVLAAGAGTRMAPLTRVRPKPLLPFGRTTLVDHAIARLRGCSDRLAVNAHHHLDAMASHLTGRVHLSVEPEPGLGTAGAVGHLAPWVDGADLAIVNGDTWCPGDLAPFAGTWDRERVRVVVAGEPVLGPTSRVVGSFMPWTVVADLPAEPSGLYEVCWGPLDEAGSLDVMAWEGPLVDCATPRDYLTANLQAWRGRSVVGEGAVVEGRISRSVVWPGAHVWPEEVLVDAIRTDAGITVLVR